MMRTNERTHVPPGVVLKPSSKQQPKTFVKNVILMRRRTKREREGRKRRKKSPTRFSLGRKNGTTRTRKYGNVEPSSTRTVGEGTRGVKSETTFESGEEELSREGDDCEPSESDRDGSTQRR